MDKGDFITQGNHWAIDPYSAEFAATLDANDKLAGFREKFYIPKGEQNREVLYLCGHSLGLQPRLTRSLLEQELETWATSGVLGHTQHMYNRPWVSADQQCVQYLVPLTGAKDESEIAIMASLSANLHFLLCAFYHPTETRYKILIEHQAFPSDYLIVASQLAFHHVSRPDAIVTVKPRSGELVIRDQDIIQMIEQEGEAIALVLLGGVQYYTGQLFDMEAITKAGHSKGCLVGFDLAHAIGNVPLYLHDWNVDFAAWCSYKYLNSGPGGVGGIFLHSNHFNNDNLTILRGWWGEKLETRFLMEHNIDKSRKGANSFQLSNLPIMSVACLLASLLVFSDADIKMIKSKSEHLTRYFRFLAADLVKIGVIQIITPEEPHRSGAQLSLLMNGLPEQFDKFEEHGIICDQRHPGALRISFVSLYTRFADVYRVAKVIRNVAIQIQQGV